MSTTTTLEIPPKKTAKAVRRHRAYDYLYGKFVCWRREAPSSTAVLPRLTLCSCHRSGFHGFLRGGPLPGRSQGPSIQRPICESLFFRCNKQHKPCLVTNTRHGVGSGGSSCKTLLRTNFK